MKKRIEQRVAKVFNMVTDSVGRPRLVQASVGSIREAVFKDILRMNENSTQSKRKLKESNKKQNESTKEWKKIDETTKTRTRPGRPRPGPSSGSTSLLLCVAAIWFDSSTIIRLE